MSKQSSNVESSKNLASDTVTNGFKHSFYLAPSDLKQKPNSNALSKGEKRLNESQKS